jgi:hypothetical protein
VKNGKERTMCKKHLVDGNRRRRRAKRKQESEPYELEKQKRQRDENAGTVEIGMSRSAGSIATSSTSMGESSARSHTTGGALEQRDVIEVEDRDVMGNVHIQRVVKSTTASTYERDREESKRMVTYTQSLEMFKSESLYKLLTLVRFELDVVYWHHVVASGRKIRSTMDPVMLQTLETNAYKNQPLANVLLFMVNDCEQGPCASYWHHSTMRAMENLYNSSITHFGDRLGDDMTTLPPLMPGVVLGRWNQLSWHNLATMISGMFGTVEREYGLYLDRRKANDSKRFRQQVPTIDHMIGMRAQMSESCGWRTGPEYEKHLYDTAMAVAVETWPGEEYVMKRDRYARSKVTAMEAKTEFMASPDEMNQYRKWTKDMEAYAARPKTGPDAMTPAETKRYEAYRARKTEAILMGYKTGMGFLMTGKIMSDETDPKRRKGRAYTKAQRERVYDTAPGVLVPAGSVKIPKVKVETKEDDEDAEDVFIEPIVVMPDGDVYQLSELDEETTRDVLRGFGVDDLVLSTNEIASRYVPERFTVTGMSTGDHVRVIDPVVGVTEHDWGNLPGEFDTSTTTIVPEHKDQPVLTMNVTFYRTATGSNYRSSVVKGVRVCPATPSVIALYERATAVTGAEQRHALENNVCRATIMKVRTREEANRLVHEQAVVNVTHRYRTAPSSVHRDILFDASVEREEHRIRSRQRRDAI